MFKLKAIILAGLGSLAVSHAGAMELVQNGGFESGDFTGWSIGGDVDGGIGGPYVAVDCTDGVQNSGNCAALFGQPAATTLSQTFTLAPSTQYTVSFALQEIGTPSSIYPNSYSVSFDGTTLASASNVGDSGGNYTTFSYTLTSGASGNSGLLQFTFMNAPGYYVVDDVSVTTAAAVPEPASYALMLLGLGATGVFVRARKQRQG